MRRASGQPRLSHGLTLKSGPRSFNLPTRRRSCCSTSPLSKVDLVELVSRALGSVTEVPRLGRGRICRLTGLGTVRGAATIASTGAPGRDQEPGPDFCVLRVS